MYNGNLNPPPVDIDDIHGQQEVAATFYEVAMQTHLEREQNKCGDAMIRLFVMAVLLVVVVLIAIYLVYW